MLAEAKMNTIYIHKKYLEEARKKIIKNGRNDEKGQQKKEIPNWIKG